MNIYKYRISGINENGYYIVEKITKTKKEAEKVKTNYLKRKAVAKVKITSLIKK